MPKQLTQLTIIKDEHPSRIFFKITAEGGTAQPQDIARVLKKAPSSITDNLNKLLKAKIVDQPRKEGKKRFYSINWTNFTRLAIKKFNSKETLLYHTTECRGLKEKIPKDEINKILIALSSESKNFEDYLRERFIDLSKKDFILPDSIDDALNELEDNLMDWNRINPTSALRRIFIEWGKLISKHKEVTESAHWKAIEKI